MRPWLGRRREFGIYGQLMVELRNDDHDSPTSSACPNTIMMSCYAERPRLTNIYTRYRKPLGPGLKLVLTLRHHVHVNKYAMMVISVVVREVYNAIIDEYRNEVLARFCLSTGALHPPHRGTCNHRNPIQDGMMVCII